VLISAFVSLTLTPMLNARMVRKVHKKSRFYEMTEPFFLKLTSNYSSSLKSFFKRRWVAIAIIFGAVGLIFGLGSTLQSELSPLEDRNWMRLSLTAPEGASFDYTDNFVDKLSAFLTDSVPEERVCLTVTSPGFSGSGAVNTAFVRLALVEASERKRSQQQIADYISK
jgi:multidrug efflux pump